jgi:hypothetical protein
MCIQWQTFHCLCQKQFLHSVILELCFLYFAIYLVYFQFKKPLKFTSKLLANVHIVRASWYFKKIHKIPLPWGHPIPVGPGAAWSKLTRLLRSKRDCMYSAISCPSFCLVKFYYILYCDISWYFATI